MLKAVYLELPWGAQVGKPTQVRASLFGDHLMDFGQVHYVWKFGDKVMDLSLSFFFFTCVWWYFCFTTVHHYKTMKTSGVYFQYKEDPYLTWISATSHLYNKTGEYTISVEAVNSVGSVTREKTIHVYGNGPHIFFSVNFNKNHLNSNCEVSV